jgi:hypothetical protein
MRELGLASEPNLFAGLVWKFQVLPNQNVMLPAAGLGILIVNETTREIKFELEVQVLTTPARELMKIANPPPTNFEYIKSVSQIIFEKIRNAGFAKEIVNDGTVAVQAGPLLSVGPAQYRITPTYVASMPGQASPD